MGAKQYFFTNYSFSVTKVIAIHWERGKQHINKEKMSHSLISECDTLNCSILCVRFSWGSELGSPGLIKKHFYLLSHHPSSKDKDSY